MQLRGFFHLFSNQRDSHHILTPSTERKPDISSLEIQTLPAHYPQCVHQTLDFYRCVCVAVTQPHIGGGLGPLQTEVKVNIVAMTQ